MSRFHAVLRVRALRVAEFTPEKIAEMPPITTVLVPLWTTVADHDGAEHEASGDECSLAICDLGAADARSAVENWLARRRFFPCLSDVQDQRVPREIRQGGIVDGVRARLVRILSALTPAGNRQSPLIELSIGDIRALRQITLAEMERVAAITAEARGKPVPEPVPEPEDGGEDGGVYLMPDSLLDRVARALNVAVTEEAVLAEIHRLHQALVEQKQPVEPAAAATQADVTEQLRADLRAAARASREREADWISAASHRQDARQDVMQTATPGELRDRIDDLISRAEASAPDVDPEDGDPFEEDTHVRERPDELAAEFIGDLLELTSERIAEIVTGRAR